MTRGEEPKMSDLEGIRHSEMQEEEDDGDSSPPSCPAVVGYENQMIPSNRCQKV